MQLQLNLSHGSTKSMRNFCGINPGKDPSKFRILVACEESQMIKEAIEEAEQKAASNN